METGPSCTFLWFIVASFIVGDGGVTEESVGEERGSSCAAMINAFSTKVRGVHGWVGTLNPKP